MGGAVPVTGLPEPCQWTNSAVGEGGVDPAQWAVRDSALGWAAASGDDPAVLTEVVSSKVLTWNMKYRGHALVLHLVGAYNLKQLLVGTGTAQQAWHRD